MRRQRDGKSQDGFDPVKTFMRIPGMAQDAAGGAMPSLYAATSHETRSGAYYGPSKHFELIGPPKLARIPHRARDEETARRLWTISELLTGVSFGMSVRD